MYFSNKQIRAKARNLLDENIFGKDWLNLHNFFIEGAALYVKSKIVPRQWGSGHELSIGSVELLVDVKDTLIEKITLTVPLDKLTSEMVEDLAEIAHEHPGKTELYFNIISTNHMKAKLFSRKTKISVTKHLMQYIEENEGIAFHIN
jgi:DNA polymerase-3 subunit alpha